MITVKAITPNRVREANPIPKRHCARWCTDCKAFDGSLCDGTRFDEFQKAEASLREWDIAKYNKICCGKPDGCCGDFIYEEVELTLTPGQTYKGEIRDNKFWIV